MSKQRALGFKKIACKKCNELVDKVDEQAESITCSKCVQTELRGYPDITREEWFRLDTIRKEKELELEESASGEEE